ncbi:LacI family DNA-binding transcriptional regulator [Planctomycetota bacterium]
MKVNRDFIAAKAGVSSATVSRVFNNPDSVSSGKVTAVLKAARKYGYSPNKMASALRRNDTGIISFLELRDPDHVEGRDYLWSYADAIKGVKKAIDSTMYMLNLQSLARDEFPKLADAYPCDGIIAHYLADPALNELVSRQGIPYVLCYRNSDPKYNTVFVDEVHGGYLAGRKLSDTGHRKPAHINSTSLAGVCGNRWEGFKKGIGGEPLLIQGGLGIKGGYESGQKLAKAFKAGKVDSVFVVNDLTAFGVMQALNEAGIRIPEDLSLIGYDNIPYLDSLPVRIATINLPLSQTYATAARLLLQNIRTGAPIYQAVKPEFVEGQSVISCR